MRIVYENWTSATPPAERVASKAIQMSATSVTDSPNRLTRMPRNSVRTGRRRGSGRRTVGLTGRRGRSAGDAAHELVRLVQLGRQDIESARRAGPEALHELGLVEGRGNHGSVQLRVQRLLMPQGGTNVALGITQKAVVSYEVHTVWLTAEQATQLERLLARAAPASGTA